MISLTESEILLFGVEVASLNLMTALWLATICLRTRGQRLHPTGEGIEACLLIRRKSLPLSILVEYFRFYVECLLNTIPPSPTLLLARKRLVALSIHQILHLIRVANANLSQPTLAFGAFVDRRRFLFKNIVRFCDGPADRTHDIRGRFDRLHSPNGFSLTDLSADDRQFDENNVSERFGGVV